MLQRVSVDRNLKILDALLDRPYLFKFRLDSGDIFYYKGFFNNSDLPVFKLLVHRGYKIPHDIFTKIRYSLRRDSSFYDLCTWLVSQGADIDARFSGSSSTSLSEACQWAYPYRIGSLLRLGANPNGIGLIKGTVDDDHGKLSRPLDILLNNRKKSPWRRNWQDVAPKMYECVKLLIEYGASTAPAPFAGDPIRILLDNIWRLVCPVARRAAGVGKDGPATISQLLDALLTVNIRPLDELCDLVVDTNPEYSRRSKGLRGNERLVRLLGQRKNLPLKFQWKNRDNWIFGTEA
ncbi:hypothetical protein F4820DRAFT_426619 [Hypoxylon rubiginosum]|uniref:Uncharacterized protein n=1 Tax=Hypoxylon rubiginosum TaxID=110542 RepID=A0ACB9YWF1_9PEZI|nr:hypothetical protein F4820DRAFT_426619 [Hypoxylon rubiginosum]